MSLRSARRWWTARITVGARALAPFLPAWSVDAVQWWLARAGPRLPILARTVAENMRAAGLYSPGVFRAYFDELALHMSNAVRIFRMAEVEGAVAALAREQTELDPTIAHIRQALDRGRGVVVAPAHFCNYLVTLTRLNQQVPVCVYLRWSGNERLREVKHAWCRAAGLPVILEPVNHANPTSRAAACVELLQQGQALVMTPGIAQKADKGVAVRLLGRQVYLPSGPASIAMLAEAPLVPVFGRVADGRQFLRAGEPIHLESLPRAQGGRRVSIQRAMQTWANGFETSLRACPQAWFLWGDSRWTRVFHGDPEYSGEVEKDRPS